VPGNFKTHAMLWPNFSIDRFAMGNTLGLPTWLLSVLSACSKKLLPHAQAKDSRLIPVTEPQ